MSKYDPSKPEGPGNWAPFDGPLDIIPKGRKALYAVYGDPKVTYSKNLITRKLEAKVDKDWARKNMMMTYDLPYGIKKLYVHRLIEPYLREALRRAEIACGDTYKIERFGCFAPRHQRHNTKLPLSDHSWGIAVDVNSNRNGGNYEGNKGDIPKEFVEAFKSVGFDWGGDWKGYCDPMHFSLRYI